MAISWQRESTVVLDRPQTDGGTSTISESYGQSMLRRGKEDNVWGIASAIDIYDCDPETIRDSDAIKRFVLELCDLIEMKRTIAPLHGPLRALARSEEDSELGLTAGFGVFGALGERTYELNYAWAGHESLESTHRLTMVLGF